MLNGEEFSGKLQLSTITNDFTIKPVFRESGPVTYSAPVYEYDGTQHPTVVIPGAYAYLVGYHPSTYEPYISDYSITGADGIFKIENVPNDVVGIIIVGAEKHTNNFQYVDADTPASEFHLLPGVQFTFDMSQGANNIIVQKGSSVTLTIDPSLPPVTLPLPEDIDLGDFFLPFGMTANGTFTFKDDGCLNFSYSHDSSNEAAFDSLSIDIKVLPQDGYTFQCWLKDGEVITDQYVLQPGDSDFVITPFFAQSVTPTPVDPTSPMAKTFDSIGDVFEAFAILTLAFALVYTYKTLRRRKHN